MKRGRGGLALLAALGATPAPAQQIIGNGGGGSGFVGCSYWDGTYCYLTFPGGAGVGQFLPASTTLAPSAPTNLVANTTAGTTQLPLTWTASIGGGPITYEADYSLTGLNMWNVAATGISATNYTITGLSSVGYDIRVDATNPAGTSPYATLTNQTPTSGGSAPFTAAAVAAVGGF
jgi:hypothetical protein